MLRYTFFERTAEKYYRLLEGGDFKSFLSRQVFYFLSLVYRAVLSILSLFPRTVYEPGIPVISVGGITSGGSGKTPVTIEVAQFLRERGFVPAILSRGYGRKSRGPLLVADSNRRLAGPAEAGDEPYMMASILKNVPTAVSENRIPGIKMLERECFSSPQAKNSGFIVFDDGFQSDYIRKEIEIVLLDASSPFGNGYLFPRGPLRMPPERIKKAEFIILTKSGLAGPGVIEETKTRVSLLNPSAGLFVSESVPAAFFFVDLALPGRIETKITPSSLDFFSGREIKAFAGLASPEPFIKTLESLGAKAVDFTRFPDHHRYTTEEIKDVFFSAGNRPVITTEKDIYKIAEAVYGLDERLGFLRMRERIEPAFFGKLYERVKKIKA